MKPSLLFFVLVVTVALSSSPVTAQVGCQIGETASDCVDRNGWTRSGDWTIGERSEWLDTLMNQEWALKPECELVQGFAITMLRGGTHTLGWDTHRTDAGMAFRYGSSRWAMFNEDQNEDQMLRTIVHEAAHLVGDWRDFASPFPGWGAYQAQNCLLGGIVAWKVSSK